MECTESRNRMERIINKLRKKEELDSVAHITDSREEALTEGYVLGIKKAIKVIEEEGVEDD